MESSFFDEQNHIIQQQQQQIAYLKQQMKHQIQQQMLIDVNEEFNVANRLQVFQQRIVKLIRAI